MLRLAVYTSSLVIFQHDDSCTQVVFYPDIGEAYVRSPEAWEKKRCAFPVGLTPHEMEKIAEVLVMLYFG